LVVVVCIEQIVDWSIPQQVSNGQLSNWVQWQPVHVEGETEISFSPVSLGVVLVLANHIDSKNDHDGYENGGYRNGGYYTIKMQTWDTNKTILKAG